MTKTSATLLIFTLGAAAERRRRRLLPGEWGEQDLALHQACLDLAFTAGRQSGCRLLVSSPASRGLPRDATRLEQTGSSFGERLAAAAADSWRIATGPLVVLGSDVPGIKPRHVAEALGRLTADPDSVVIGPSPDGGLYLLASHRPLDHLLSRVAWCRRDTRRQLVRALRKAGLRVTFLDPLRDLDSRADLERWLSGFLASLGDPLRAIASSLRRILGDRRRGGAWIDAPSLRLCTLSAVTGRAPPAHS